MRFKRSRFNIVFSFRIMTFLKSNSVLPQQSDLVSSIFQQQQLGRNVDFSLVSGDKSISVHWFVLRNSSPMLNVLLNSSCSCSKPSSLILPEYYSALLSNFVTLLYTGTVTIAQGLVTEMKELSCMLGVSNIDSFKAENKTDTVRNMDYREEVNDDKVIKLSTNIAKENGKSFKLSLPKSRHVRNFANIGQIKTLDGFHGRLQNEYNQCPVGKYAGPYDQSEKLKLKIQLRKSDLDYVGYSEFIHSESEPCQEFCVSTNYENVDDHEKIDTLAFRSQDNQEDDNEYRNKNRIYYTCKLKRCKIPCPCAPCCTSDGQCKEHRIQHVRLFDESKHAVVVRSTEEFCRDEKFFSDTYINKYSGIPIECVPCKKDLLHHKIYHISHHEDCKFCVQNWYKLSVKSKKELHEMKAKEDHYYRSVCPHCNKRFCEPASAEKHIQFEHGNAPFRCEACSKTFHSKQAKDYHDSIKHLTGKVSVQCSICEKVLASSVSLNAHMKYVHSEERKHSCTRCDSKFKHKKDLTNHCLYVHNSNLYKEMYLQPKDVKKFDCEQCNSSYQRKKDLNVHIRNKHTGDEPILHCDLCPLKFKEKKSLVAHKKHKHENSNEENCCSVCGKKFSQRKTLNRHMLSHGN